LSVPALTTALLLFGAPVETTALTAATPALSSAFAANDADDQTAPASAAPAGDASTAPAPAEITPPAEPVTPPPVAHATQHDGDVSEIVVTGRTGAPPGDPLEKLNIQSYKAVQAVDTAVIRPVAMGYRRIVPHPIRDGVRNFINNLREPVVFLNYMLQLKPGKAVETVGRFTINTTAGVGGVFDFAKRKPFYLPRRPNGLANTLGYWGVKPGPFLFLPLIGPTTVRDMIGDGLDRLVLPLGVGKPFNKPYVGIPVYVFSSMDQRAEFDETLEKQHNSAQPYTATREDYLKAREDMINYLHGRGPPVPKPGDPRYVAPPAGSSKMLPTFAPLPETPATEPAQPSAPAPAPKSEVRPTAEPAAPATPQQ
jgi:phospholipid-binding lipoprotein MlaA